VVEFRKKCKSESGFCTKICKKNWLKILGIVGRDGGYTAKVADACIIIPTPNPANTTPHAEAFQAVIWHLIVSHPKLKFAQTKWNQYMLVNQAIFLDRDGVLNESIVKNGKPYPPATLAELVIAEDVLPALQMLKSLDYLLICVTNQPDVLRKNTTREIVESIHSKLMELLPLNEILVCYHDDKDECLCRKPLPGLLFQQQINIILI